MPENKKKYTGAWCPSITPFDADGKLDLAALEKHFSRLSEAGTDGVLLMGSIGEFTALSMDERVSLIHAARTMTHLPLIANVSGTCMEDMTRLADAAYSEGYEAVMALPHYYFAQTPRQLEAYFDTLGGRFEGEWLIYNFPARTGCDADAALIAKLAARFPRFMGVKDTVDCASHTRAIVRAVAEVREDFSVLCGFDEYFIPNLMNGGDGVLSGLNNVVPELFTQAKTAFRSGQFGDLCAATTPGQGVPANDYAVTLQREHPEVTAFGTLHPGYEAWESQLERLKAAGIRGLKLHPDFQHFWLDDPRLLPMFEAAQDDFIFLFHIGDNVPPEKNPSCPYKLAALLDRFPRLRCIAGHLGGYHQWEHSLKALVGRDVWLDTSSCTPFIQPDLLKAILHKHPQDRILFGSDYPLYDPGDAMMHLQEKAELGDADLDRYCSNADALFA